ncbi:MAG: hypothetical protein ACT4O3_07200 [Elusimicrobiota bacterium]
MRRKISWLSTAVVFLSGSLFAQDSASWMRTRSASALNPNLSVIADFTGVAGPRGDASSNRFALRETEIGLQAAVDPYARADVFIAIHEGESAELEEGYVTLLALPWGVQARGGKLLANFGKLNMVHGHELPQVDRPLALSAFLGEEGLGDAGLEVSRIFAPLGVFTELTYGVLNGLGGGHGHGEDGETILVPVFDENGLQRTDASGKPMFAEVTVRPEEEETPRTLRNFAHTARARFYKDLTASSNLELGVSGAWHEPEGLEQRRLGGADLTFRWKPLTEGLYKSFLWRTEVLHSHRALKEETDLAGAVTRPEGSVSRKGGYSYVEVQPARRWRFGLRGDYSEDPEAKDEVFALPDGSARQTARSITRAVSPYAVFGLSEFNRFRVQYSRTHLPSGEDEHRGFFQWTIVLGPHGAHPF